MIKFYPSRWGLLTDAALGLSVAAILTVLGVWALGQAPAEVVVAGVAPFVLGFLSYGTLALVWWARRVPSLEASEELFSIRRVWGSRVVVRWSEVAAIAPVILEKAGGGGNGELVLRFVMNTDRFSAPLEISQRRLARPLPEIIELLLEKTAARYVLDVKRALPPEWRRPGGLRPLALLILGLAVIAGATLTYFWLASGT